ncbi:IS1595 family transposase [Elizabethkingia anophelis]|uniref:IS1595 family transposase n=1 Tax=Elizabethkingia anophelis TaxID=1117645 RepID=UPI000994AD43|nr:IS1595 family transposase [Elizabethkingia anophelis]AQW94778.1 transposase [Elizabethkingia anophelis]MCL1690445.1 IS1595 family transposase [Elizabethkingia anophelis]MDV3508481.1 IS1595 family transposase [Elizabethkingia anophelis]MDV3541117.1 IS1595 family transposase [Elizabethkingia anophelis]MDV4009971.1 IS1595 family transposase [Elizabethkingia anophelis]
MINTNFNSVFQLMEMFSTEEKCIKYLEQLRWMGVVESPFDCQSKVYKCSNNRYRCKNTGKYFNAKTGTLFENSKVALRKWFLAIWLVTSHKKGISSIQLAKDIAVTQKTAWFMLQRIRACFGIENQNELEGVVECDETFIGGKNKNRHKDKKVKQCQGRSFKDKVPVMGMLQRGGKMNAFVVNDTKGKSIKPLVYQFINQSAEKVITDEWWAYNGLSKYYNHKVIDHSRKEYVSLHDNTVHTNSIEGSWNILKRSVSGMYNHVSKKHLQKYVDEFVYRFNLRKVSDQEKFRHLLVNSNVRTRYKELTV